MLTDKSS